MRNDGTRRPYGIAALMIALGALLFAAGMAANGWNWDRLSTVRYETNEYEIAEAFRSISVRTDTADIELVPYDGDGAKVICFEDAEAKHSATVRDGTLAVEIHDERHWSGRVFSIRWGAPKLTLYLPRGEYDALTIEEDTGEVALAGDFAFGDIAVSTATGDVLCETSAAGAVQIRTNTGDIRLQALTAGALELSTATGEIRAERVRCAGEIKLETATGDTRLADVSCERLDSNGRTGDIALKDALAEGEMRIERTTGGVSLDDCDAASLFIETATGDVRGSLRSGKAFAAHSGTGRVSVPESTNGGRCEIGSGTGDIVITVK